MCKFRAKSGTPDFGDFGHFLPSVMQITIFLGVQKWPNFVQKCANFVPTGRVIKYPTKCAFFGLPEPPAGGRPGGLLGRLPEPPRGCPPGTPSQGSWTGAIGGGSGRGCSYSLAPFGRSTTLFYCHSNAVAFHSLTLVTVLTHRRWCSWWWR